MITKCEGICDSSAVMDQLPDDICHYILSFMDIFDAIGMRLVSKRWKNLFCKMPYLDFNVQDFWRRRYLLPRQEIFKDFINWVISRSSTKIIRFQLKCDYFFNEEQIFRWICIAASRNVEEVILSFDLSDSEAFKLPFSLVNCDSLRVLKLRLFGYELELPSFSGFCVLKCLELDHVQLSDDLARNLICRCPLLENLILRDCILEDAEILDISSPTIKYIYVDARPTFVDDNYYSHCDIKISCPNLLFFKYAGPIPRHYLVDNLSLLQSICIHPHFYVWTMSWAELGRFMCGVLKVVHKIITIKMGPEIIRALYGVLDELILSLSLGMFHELKYLNLWLSYGDLHMHVMMLLLKHSPCLEALNLFGDAVTAELLIFKHEDFSRITCLTSHLKFVRLIEFWGEENEMEFVRFLLENALVLEKLIILCSDAVKISEIVETLLTFPRSSSCVVVDVIHTDSDDSFDFWLRL